MSPMAITFIFLALAVVLFVWDKLPISLTSMIICIGLIISGVIDAKTGFAGFVNSNLIVIIDMCIIGGALFETGMATKIGGLVTRFAKTERQQIMGIVAVGGVMSGVLSNTGTTAMLIPVVIGISAKAGFARSRLLMPLAFAASIGANLTMVGASGNLLAQTAIEKIGQRFGFFEIGVIGLPILITTILYFGLIGYKFLPEHQSGEDSTYSEAVDYSSVPKWKQNLSLVILLMVVLGMMFEKKIGIPLNVTGAAGAVLLVLTGVMTEKQVYKSIDMKIVFLFGGTLALASALDSTGAGATLANGVIGALGDHASPFVLLTAVFLIALVLTNFMSNTATTALLVPIGMSIATNIGADPRAVLIATVIGSSMALATPIGCPSNTMVYSVGGYKFTDYVKAGLPITIINAIVALILLPIFFPFFPG